MPHPLLFGPVPGHFADQNLRLQRQAGIVLAFDHAGTADLAIGAAESWETVQARLPPNWQPDAIVLQLAYTTIPACLWSAPLPIVGLAGDWNLLWHYYRHQLRRCDLILTDTCGVNALVQEGIHQARAANLFGCELIFLERTWPDSPRDIDILFAGNLHPAVQRQRLPWLARLARLGRRWRVAIHTGVYGEPYRQLLGRARIVFNRSIRGECNLRAFEAAAAGALLFQEAENREVPTYFHDRQECVYYTDTNLEDLLEHYLESEEERRVLVNAARERVRRYSFEALWENVHELIDREWPRLTERARQRPSLSQGEDLLSRSWQALNTIQTKDPAGRHDHGKESALRHDLESESIAQPQSAPLHNALGLEIALDRLSQNPPTNAIEEVIEHFQRAFSSDPGYIMAGLNLAEALAQTGKTQGACEQARRLASLLDRKVEFTQGSLDAAHFPPGFSHFRVEWERAAWLNAGRPAAEVEAKRNLLRWRLQALLAELTGSLAHFYEAAFLRPDLPHTQAALGAVLSRAGHPTEAVSHLGQALADNPFDCETARTLFQVLKNSGDANGQRRLARDRWLLSQAAPLVVPAESWFAEAPPAGDELASVIILCCNQLEYTRLCLESVFRQTRRPYELILVDNGSNDGTTAYLDEVRSQPGPARVVVIRNETNRGYPAGCNQAAKLARGQYLILLNNDTIVTKSWLEGLIACAIHDWPRIGLVGAVTNYTALPQQIPVDYANRKRLEAFAARRRQEFAGQAMDAPRLTGFCLLVRREIFQQLGGFDERFGLGYLDDDDLCLRARGAGFRLVMALSVFVHHFGGRTCASLGIAGQKQWQANYDVFQAIWGAERTAAYLPNGRATPLPPLPAGLNIAAFSFNGSDGDSGAESELVPQTTALPLRASTPLSFAATRPRRPRISLCLIVKNEEGNLAACLDCASDLVDEIVVVDTGSTDGTKEIAARYGARVSDFAWKDDFSAARNESLCQATGDWVFWLDADDRLDEENRRRLQLLFANLTGENIAYMMKCYCLPDTASGTSLLVDHVRLFPNRPEIRWQYRVHEQILPAVMRLGGQVCWTDVIIHHRGYQDPALRRRKLERDLRLLRLEDAEHPDDSFTLFNIGQVYQELGRITEAMPLLQRSLERSAPNSSIVRKLYALIVNCHRQLEQREEAVIACQAGLARFPDDVELLFLHGLLLQEMEDFEGAEVCLLRLFQTDPKGLFASVDAGIRGYKARHNLAIVYSRQGKAAEAEAQWRAALAERPNYPAAWLGLGELFLLQGRWEEAAVAIRRLEESPAEQEKAVLLRAKLHIARQEFEAGRRLLANVIGSFPQALAPRVLLSELLLQEGRDWDAAEEALLTVLKFDPGHVQARRNLTLLRCQPGRALKGRSEHTQQFKHGAR